MAAKQGFIMYYTKGVAIGTEVTVRYKESGRLSGVVVKRGSTVYHICTLGFFIELFSAKFIICTPVKLCKLCK